MNGFAFMQQVRADPKVRHLRVVAITGVTSHQDLMRAWKAGFDGYLVKPIDCDAALATLQRGLVDAERVTHPKCPLRRKRKGR